MDKQKLAVKERKVKEKEGERLLLRRRALIVPKDQTPSREECREAEGARVLLVIT